MNTQDQSLAEYVCWSVGASMKRIITALEPKLGHTRATRMKTRCEEYLDLYPEELVFGEDYLLAPVGTIIGRRDALLMGKLDNGNWTYLITNDDEEFPSAHVSQWGPYRVYGWGTGWE
ncbi:hypothetical protein [Corynebacterium mastitidis]|uniref:hypothetical protein n=1 Tax=Corynebacterium mastitidis TaxID=161890 RepID=UPI0012EABB87|nr:hypothetical protein [Corynebacterium mastitidis]